MNSIISITESDVVTINSREVAEMVEKKHADLLRDIKTYIEYLGESNFAFTDFFILSEYKTSQNKIQPCYEITCKGCEFIANKMTGQKGTLFTAKFINRFHEMEDYIKRDIPSPLHRKDLLALAVLEAQKMIEEKDEIIEAQKPKVIFADAVSVSHTSILVGELAKILKQNGIDIGPNRLFEWLRKKGYLISRKGTDYNMPTQYSMERGLFEIKETVVTHSDGHTSINKTPKVTGKGQIYFINKFKSCNQLAVQ